VRVSKALAANEYSVFPTLAKASQKAVAVSEHSKLFSAAVTFSFTVRKITE